MDLQHKLQKDFQAAQKINNDDAFDHNALKTLHQMFARVFLLRGETRQVVHLQAFEFMQKTQLKNCEKNSNQALPNSKFTETWSELVQRVDNYPASQKILDDDSSDYNSLQTLHYEKAEVFAKTTKFKNF